MDRAHGSVAIFGTIETCVGAELGNDRRRGAEPLVVFFEGIVVEQRDRHIFIAPALATIGIRLAEQVEI